MKKFAILSSILILILIFILPMFIKSLQFDFINRGGRLSSSTSKEESIERGVFICDLALVSVHRTVDSVSFEITEAWIEKIWRDGVWYWTTRSEDIGYRIKIQTSLTQDQQNKLHVTNNRKSALGDYEGLKCSLGICTGTIKEIPKSDTLRYTVLRKDNLDFTDDNIIGELVFVLKRD